MALTLTLTLILTLTTILTLTADIEICTVDNQKQTPHKIKTEFMPVQVKVGSTQ